MSIITHKFRTSNADKFKQDFSISDYYIFASSTDLVQTRNSEYSVNEFLETTLFGKKVYPEDVFFMIDNNRWQYGTVYDQYDDKEDLSAKKFYVVVYPSDNATGDYRIYKCISNNHGAQSIDAPSYDEQTDDQIYRMGDGYIWKFMYSLSTIEYQKYAALRYIPIIETNSANTAINRTIDHIEVENFDLNRGYELRSGIIRSVETNNIVIYAATLDLSEITNYYAGQNFYVISPDNVARVYTIDTYTYNISSNEAIITLLNKDSFIEENFNFQIFPRIEIEGDGIGAEAIPKVNALGTIESVVVLNKGNGYTRATAKVITPLYGFDTQTALSTDVEAVLRPILSPVGGHGINIKEELLSRRILVYTTLTDTNNLFIPSSNVYTRLGLVKNPEFTSNTAPDLFDNRLELELDSNILTVDEIVTQNYEAPVSFSAKVHEIDGNIVYLCNYHGPYKTYPSANSSAEGYEDIPINLKSPIISSQGQNLNINNSTRSPYVQKTGEVYYMTFFSPITRTLTTNEEYKIVIEF